jgi:hypothetical protein
MMKHLIKIFSAVVAVIFFSTTVHAQVTSVNGATGDVHVNLSLNSSNLSITGGNAVNLPYGTGDITSVTAGTGLSGGGAAGNITIDANTGGALWNATKLQGRPVITTAPSSGQVLKWSGTDWAPAADETGSGGSGSWLQSGSTIYFNTGNVGIGTLSPDQKLTVNGKIHAKEVLVDLSVPGPDYVFAEGYPLMPLDELETYVKQNRHLPGIPPAVKMEETGINLSEMSMYLLEKTEELALYIIGHEKRIATLEKMQLTNKQIK